MTDDERRLQWARDYLDIDPETGEPRIQDTVTEYDLVEAMRAEAEHRENAIKPRPPSEITIEMLSVAGRQADALRERGLECTDDEVVLAAFISNIVGTTITLHPDLATKGTKRLAADTPEGVILCLWLARSIEAICEAETPEQRAAALNEGVTAVVAHLTTKTARDLSRLKS